ncbi:MAG: Uma2 family endonuclease [Acidobacteria bacterium]|nr:Uma2 family endonuclease [Acidobacteriota bacterium]
MAVTVPRSRVQALALELHTQPVVDMSREQFLRFCQRNRDVRIERNAEGSIAVMAPTGGETGARSGRLFAAVFRWAEDDGSGVAFDSSTGFELPNGAVRSPDAAWVARARLERLPAEDKQGFLPLCPDFVIELLSPSDSRAVVRRKMEEYRDNGARLGWLVDPGRRQVAIYRADGGAEQRTGSGVLTGESVLPGFVLDVAAIWKAGF